MNDFLEQVRERVVVSDGAMGTMLYSHGVFINRSFDEMNLSQPAVVKEIHEAYAQAGAEILETNTFGANRVVLEKYGLREQLAAINRAGVELARGAVNPGGWVAGAIGPLGVYLEPLGKISFAEAREAFAEQAAALAAAGADLLMLETFGQVGELREAIAGAREACALPIVAQITIDDEGRALDGTPAAEAARRMERWGADVVGINCSGGPVGMLEALEQMAHATGCPLIAQPNAGKPRNVDGRNLYMVSPEYLADYARQFIAAGAKIVGGCCGTTPEHIKWIRNYVRSTTPGKRRFKVETSAQAGAAAREPVPPAQRSELGRKLREGKFVTLVEILPPRGSDPAKEIKSAAFFQSQGADAINIPDGPRANARMSNQALAVMMRAQLAAQPSVEPVLHYCCRDRNVISMQSDLLGAYALGLRNLILITGDPPKLGNYPDATAVFDVDAIGLANLVRNLNSGLDLGGNAVGGQTGFLIGVGANPGAVNYEEELRRYFWKVEAGADYVVTQPVFDIELLERFLRDTAEHAVPLIAGIWPLTSLRQAEFMQNELRVHVPEAVLARMRASSGADAAKREGLAIAKEMVRALRGRIAGVQISVLGRDQAAAELLRVARGEESAASPIGARA
ncbi:MAG TPA: bifunctional homocysteine S-methyltransferase/methylenetetrahydrofolate reductase [Terriglobales bacterium]|nr:bifunctional homocysteine S-methyltransferase/methylenetetrahydrofolate reductase [Terriglobales bacterium]